MHIRVLSLWLALLFGLQAQFATASERVLLEGPKLSLTSGKLKQTAAGQGSVKVIVGLRVPFAPEARLKSAEAVQQRNEIAAAGSSFRNRYMAAAVTATEITTYDSIPFVALDVTPAMLARLAADSSVISIIENGYLKANLAQSVPLVRAPEAWDVGFTGAGQTVAIIDTGVDKTHPFLANKVVSEACYSSGGWCPRGRRSSTAVNSGMPCPGEDCAHGTHVAGIAAGKGESFSGVAPDASLIAIQVFSQDPEVPQDALAYYSDIIAGLNRVYGLRNSFRIASVNMSLGSGLYPSTCDGINPAFTAIVNNLKSAGIATVIASGNDGNASTFPFRHASQAL